MTAKFPRPHSFTRFADSPFLMCAFAAGSALLCTVLLLICGTAAACAQKNPAVWVLPVSLGSLLLSSFGCGMISGRCRHAPLLCGLCSGGTFMLLVTLLSCLPFGDSYTAVPLLWNCILHAGIPLCSLCGAALSAKKKPHRKRHFKKRRF